MKMVKWFRHVLPLAFFFIYNTLLIAPEYYFKRHTTTFFPSSKLPPDIIIGSLKMWFVRENADLFRMIAEVVIWFSILMWFSKKSGRHRTSSAWLFIFYLLLLLFEWYFLVSYKLYGELPNLLNDVVLIREVLPMFLQELGFDKLYIWVFILLGFLGLGYGLWRFMEWSMRRLGTLKTSTLFVNSVLLLLLATMLQLGISYTFNPERDQPYWKTLQWITPQIYQSAQTQDSLNISQKADYYSLLMEKPLMDTPNIYLLFIESYGSVVQLLEEEGPLYKELMDSLDQVLHQEDWYVASTYSLPPVIGGRSWLSFTSAMTGIHVKNHLYFNELLTNHYDYPHLVRFLKQNGYYTYRMKTMSNQKQSTDISYALADRFYAFDEWIKFQDIPYRGFKYDLLGGIPDQYAINFFADSILQREQGPFFFFSINMSSHAPWQPAPPFVQDWSTLDTMDEPLYYQAQKSLDESMLYYESVEYVLKTMFQFILEKVNDNALVILIGDHQPPGMTFLCEGVIDEYAVPLHILSKNKTMIEPLWQKSFNTSLHLNPDQSINQSHDAIYDLIIELLQQ